MEEFVMIEKDAGRCERVRRRDLVSAWILVATLLVGLYSYSTLEGFATDRTENFAARTN